MEDEIKKFIEKNIDLIDNNEWDEVYSRFNYETVNASIGDFTRTLLASNINPLLSGKLENVPFGYLTIDHYSKNIEISPVIENLHIPHGIKDIGGRAFYGNRGIKEVTLPNTIETIKFKVFENCVNMEKITYQGTPEMWLDIALSPHWLPSKPVEIIFSDGTHYKDARTATAQIKLNSLSNKLKNIY